VTNEAIRITEEREHMPPLANAKQRPGQGAVSRTLTTAAIHNGKSNDTAVLAEVDVNDGWNFTYSEDLTEGVDPDLEVDLSPRHAEH